MHIYRCLYDLLGYPMCSCALLVVTAMNQIMICNSINENTQQGNITSNKVKTLWVEYLCNSLLAKFTIK